VLGGRFRYTRGMKSGGARPRRAGAGGTGGVCAGGRRTARAQRCGSSGRAGCLATW
jgi:hypothetical protein